MGRCNQISFLLLLSLSLSLSLSSFFRLFSFLVTLLPHHSSSSPSLTIYNLGATIMPREKVVNLQVVNPHQVAVKTESGRRFTGERLVVTAGAWANDLLHQLKVYIKQKTKNKIQKTKYKKQKTKNKTTKQKTSKKKRRETFLLLLLLLLLLFYVLLLCYTGRSAAEDN